MSEAGVYKAEVSDQLLCAPPNDSKLCLLAGPEGRRSGVLKFTAIQYLDGFLVYGAGNEDLQDGRAGKCSCFSGTSAIPGGRIPISGTEAPAGALAAVIRHFGLRT